MKLYDKFLYCFFKLEKKDDISSVFFLSFIQFVNFLTIIVIIGIIFKINIFKIGNWQKYLYAVLPLFMISNLFYLLYNKKFKRILETYKLINKKSLEKGRIIISIYMIISVILFLFLIIMFPQS